MFKQITVNTFPSIQLEDDQYFGILIFQQSLSHFRTIGAGHDDDDEDDEIILRQVKKHVLI